MYSLPLFIHPEDGKNSAQDLKRWITENKDTLEEQLLNHGTRMMIQYLSVLQAECRVAHQ